METVRIWDPGSKKVGSGIQDKHPGSATLEHTLLKNFFVGKNFNNSLKFGSSFFL
jgi:hypothetical protein